MNINLDMQMDSLIDATGDVFGNKHGESQMQTVYSIHKQFGLPRGFVKNNFLGQLHSFMNVNGQKQSYLVYNIAKIRAYLATKDGAAMLLAYKQTLCTK